MERGNMVWDMFVAAQGRQKDVKGYVDSLLPKKEFDADELLKDFGENE